MISYIKEKRKYMIKSKSLDKMRYFYLKFLIISNELNLVWKSKKEKKEKVKVSPITFLDSIDLYKKINIAWVKPFT